MQEEVFCLTKSLLAVKFGRDPQTLLLRLPVGGDVGILGSSVIPGCVEIICNAERYHIFKADLLLYSTSRRVALAACA